MKKLKTILIVVFAWLSYCSCSSGAKNNHATSPANHNENLLVIDLDKADYVDRILYSSLFNPPRSILLETKDDCLIKCVSGVQIHQNRIYILDNEYNKLLVYDMNGAFMYQIGRVGMGPGEYSNITDFTIDTQHQFLYMLNHYTNDIFKYSIEPVEFVEKIKTETADEYIFGIQYVAGSLYANVAPAYEGKNKDLLMKINLPEGSLDTTFLDTDAYNRGFNIPLRAPGGFFHSRTSETPQYIQMFMDTIVTLSRNEVTPTVMIKSKDFASYEDIERLEKMNDEKGYFDMLSLEGKIHCISHYVEFNNYICFQFIKGHLRHYLLYNRITEETKITESFINDYVQTGDWITPFEIWFNDEKGVYSVLTQDYIPHFIKVAGLGELSPTVDRYEELRNMKEDVNPVIFFHEYKN
ncbi:6-bladed beta-propeller [Bacteroides sp. UBA939]|uniref:6-bladed beta-propeller n=1 Tax=Bacteroides sp. UBA939 TaxID=1946092 RepID=UPI0025C464AB|nr:6-bladed beta-propeller [Bacteroides sp. UBA939]